MEKKTVRAEKLFEIYFSEPVSEEVTLPVLTRQRRRPPLKRIQVLANSTEEALLQVRQEFPDAIIDSTEFICVRVQDAQYTARELRSQDRDTF
jgi:ribosome recycling factor